MFRGFIQKHKSILASILLTIITLLAGWDFYRFFLGPTRVFSQFSGQWLVIATVWGLALILLPIGVWLPVWKPAFPETLAQKTETFRTKAKFAGWLAASIVVALLTWAYLFSPWKQVFTFLLGGVWLHVVVFLWTAQFLEVCIATRVDWFAGRREFMVTMILLLSLKLIGPLFSFYPGILAIIILLVLLALLHQYQPFLIPSMAQKAEPAWKKVAGSVWLPVILIAAGLIVYLIQARHFFYFNTSIMDEGTYVYKGYLFALGKLIPYQNYGAWTNKAPLAFLIPGYIQTWFGPGLRTARYFAIFTQLVFLPGLLLAAYRMGGRWGAVAAIFSVALVPTQISVYSAAFSQGIVACAMVWVLALTLGEDRPAWQLILGGFISGVIVMTRENLLPLPVMLTLYIFWQHGFKKACLTAAAAILPIAFFTVLYWPNIMRIWAYWIPASITPFLNPWRHLGGGNRIWAFAKTSFSGRAASFLNGTYVHFIPLIGSLALLLLLPIRNRAVRATWRWRTVIFLATTYLILVLAHGWASFMTDECVFCFSGYMSFFSSLGILFVITAWPLITVQQPVWRIPGFVLLLLAATAGVSYNLRDSLERLLYARLPFNSGSSLLWKILDNSFGIDFNISKQIVPAFIAVMICSAIFSGVWMAIKLLPEHLRQTANFWRTSLLLIMASMSLLGMSIFLNATRHSCKADIVSTYERAGKYVAGILPPGATVYWQAESPILLLYLDVKVFPPQLNDRFSFFRGSNTDLALRYGYWNDEVAHQWQLQADYALIEKGINSDNNVGFISKEYQEIGQTEPLSPCDSDSSVLILKHLK
jgi:hypothetical protein